jgi:hypothetical protein
MATQITFQPAGSKIISRKGLERVADVDPRLTRSHYFDSRLLTAEDLTRDQIYLDSRLREVGRALGHGVMSGLELSLSQLDGEIAVQPGIAVTAAGRVLELTKPLSLNLSDKAKITEQNNGRYRRFNSSLYAILIKYAEIGTDVAEMFPTDLGENKTVQYDVITEGVQLAMVPLHLPLMRHNPLHVRAYLMQQLYNDNSAAGAIPDDAVALGVLAIYNDTPQWLDTELLRQPLRAMQREGDRQADLYRRYQHLFQDVMEERSNASLSSNFAATDYFRWLPPVGSLPKGSIDPVDGRQGFFPENYNVWVAPVRKAELELIIKESMVLPPLHLDLDEPMDLVILAPLNNSDYAEHAARLQRPPNTTTGKPAGMDLLRLRLYPQRPVHELDLDRNTWQTIWNIVTEDELIYVRRPLRTAETQLSGIVLNTPTTTPTEELPPPPSPSDINLLVDEDSVFLKRVNISSLGKRRISDTDASRDALATVEAEFGQNAVSVQRMLYIMLRIEPAYDEVLWQTLLAVTQADRLVEFHDTLIERQGEGQSTPEIVLDIGAEFGLGAGLLAQWSDLGSGA